MTSEPTPRERRFPLLAGVLLGLGLGGFFDGIVFHQLLQWHHLLSSAHEPADMGSLRLNILWDGLFHTLTYLVTGAGLVVLWRAARQRHHPWSHRQMVGALLMGWGTFNVVEGVVNHTLLGLHHVNETAPPEQWLAYDLAFLAWGLAMLGVGWLTWRAGQHRPHVSTADRRPDRVQA